MAFTLSNWLSPLSILSSLLKPARRDRPGPAPAATRQPAPPAPDFAATAAVAAQLPQACCAWTLPAPHLRAVHYAMPTAALLAGAASAAPATPDCRPAAGEGRAQRRRPPLRVIRRDTAGDACRLVISGRMADVCAELDRLALH
ncbi:hypothetical protein GCM10027019_30090 [Melaminivora jejuensis]|uniref:hypothetical protein n=1 Tax=Melaminivora jejuensis TaxID=1267217 RepID=UPI001ADFBBF2|nr:hypothetical protein [Melaminivora jejuensis]UHJ63820.1 hypothetical protein LVC68_10395 [Melaminivora jejuensis]